METPCQEKSCPFNRTDVFNHYKQLFFRKIRSAITWVKPVVMKSPTRLGYLVLVCVTLYLLMLYYNTSTQMKIFDGLSRINPVPHTEALISQKLYAEAYDYLTYFMAYDYVKSDPEADDLLKNIIKQRANHLYQLRKISEGILTGQSDEREGQITAIMSDFFIIGDIRDLTKEGLRFSKGEQVDEVRAALAAIGIVATTGNLLTSGGATATKIALSLLKMMNSIHKLPQWLRDYLIENARLATQAKDITPLNDLFNRIYELMKATGIEGTVKLINISEDIDSFRTIAEFGIYFKYKAPVLLEITSNSAIEVFQSMEGVPKEIFLEAATFGQPGLMVLERVGYRQFEIYLNKLHAASEELR